jgi:PBP1b-binding outer membrane lipoprotein LpoB
MPGAPLRILACLAALALVVSGCGTDKKQAYDKAYTQAATEFKQAVDKIPAAGSLKDRVPALESFKSAIDTLAGKLDGLDPPGDVAKANDEAVQRLHAMSADLTKLEAAVKTNDRAAAIKLTPKLQSDQADLQSVLDQIDQKVNG